MKFKIGDKVRVLAGHENKCGTLDKKNKKIDYLIITSVEEDRYRYYGYFNDLSVDSCYSCYKDDDLELLEPNNINKMNIKEQFVLAFKSEPEKTFRKTGITNGDDVLTEDGKSVFLSWLLKKFQDDFKKEVADELLKEVEKEK